MSTSSPSSTAPSRTDAAIAAGVAVLVFAIGLSVYRQGLNFLDDGLWLLGAQTVAEGKVLYRDLFTIYGPARFVLLAAVFAIAGASAFGLAVLQALVSAAAAGAGVWAAGRLGVRSHRWLIVAGVLALGPFKPKLVALAVLALLWGVRLCRPLDARAALGLGALTGVVGWFGLDALLQALLLVGLTLLLVGVRPSPADLLRVAGGFGVVSSVPLLWAAATGSLSVMLWDAGVYPLLHFRSEMGISLGETLTDVATLGRPFAGLKTGEELGGFLPAHRAWRALSLWSLAVAVGATPVLALLRWRRSTRPPLVAALVALAVVSWIPLAGRGDASHLMSAAMAGIWSWPWLLGGVSRRWIRHGLAAAVALLMLAPLLAETLWLAAHSDRDGTRTWQRPRAGVVLSSTRIDELESTMASLPGAPQDPAVFWPAQPGLHFLFDIPVAVPQVTLLGGEVRDPRHLVEDLRRARPARVVLAARWRLGGRSTRELCPEAWSFFRRAYRVQRRVADTEDPLFVLEPVSGGRAELLRRPVSERLFDRRQTVANATSGDLRDGRRVGQSLPVGDLDLSGLRVRWVAARGGITVPVQIVLWEWEDGALGEALQGYRSQVVFAERQKVSEFEFSPPPATANRSIAITLELTEPVGPPVELMWHERRPGGEDLFPEGTALVDGRPIDADLYFTTY